MNFRRWRGVRSTSKQQLRKQNEKRRRGYVARQYEHLLFEPLEWRQLLTVTLAPIAGSDANDDFNVPSGKALYVPLTGVDVGNTVTYSANSANSNVKLDVLDGHPTLVLNISGTRQGESGQPDEPFTGQLRIELFDDLAPVSVDRITDLANAGTYNGKSFYRIIQDFMIQGGLQGNPSQTNIIDEFNTLLTMNSPGLLAMANPGNPDLNTSEIFITDIDRPTALTPQYLNFRHTIFGQLTSGFETYDNIMNAKGITAINSTPNPAVVITSASVIDGGDQSAVLRVLVPNDFTGTADITVTATSSDTTTAIQTFGINAAPVSAATDKIPIVIAPVTDKTTTVGTPITFQVPVLLQDGLDVTWTVTGGTGFRGALQNVTAQVTENGNGTATVTLTPAAGFKGTLNLILHADDNRVLDPEQGPINLHDAMAFTLSVFGITSTPAHIGSGNDDNVSISGTGEAGATISVTASDGSGPATTPKTAVVGEDGTWTVSGIDVSGLDDGTITFTATDTTNSLAPATSTGNKDTVAPTVTITTPVTINNVNQNAYSLSGMSEPLAVITLIVSGTGPNVTPATVTANASGNWTFNNLNLSGFADGTVTFTASAVDQAGNPSAANDVETATMDTVAPTGVDIDNATNPVNIGNVSSASIDGDAEEGVTVTVTVTDGTTTTSAQTTTADGDGWSFSNLDLSSLKDGDITYRIVARDAAGNETVVTREAEKSTLTVDPITAVNKTNISNYTISGDVQPGATVQVVISDSGTGSAGTADVTVNATVQANGDWQALIPQNDLMGLLDGTLTFTITATVGSDSTEVERTAAKDTVSPIVTLDDITQVVNKDRVEEFTIGGDLEGADVGTQIIVTITDSASHTDTRTITVNDADEWEIDLDLSEFADGLLTFSVKAKDAAGNESTSVSDTTTKDTTAPTVTVGSFTNPVTPENETAASISGTAPGATTVTVVVVDEEGNESAPVTVNVTAGTNAWSVTNLDLSDLEDGDLTYQITAKDANDNETTVERDATKSTADNSIRGIAYVDLNGNGRFDSGDAVLRNVMIQLHGVDGQNNPVPSKSIRTGSDGSYRFNDLPNGTYTIREIQPHNVSSHSTNVGSHGGKKGTNFVSGIELEGGDNARNYNFGERGLTSSNITIMDFLASTPSVQARYDQAMSSGHTVNPVVGSIKLLSDNPTNAATVRFEVRFNKDVTGVNSTDFRVVKTGAITGESINPIISGSGKRYIVTVNTGTGTGKIGLALRDDDSVMTSSAKRLGGTGTANGDFVSRYYTIDKTAPGVTLDQPPTFINESNQDSIDLSGTVSNTGGEPTTIKVTINDADASTPAIVEEVEVDGDGNWNIDNVDVSDLMDGALTFSAVATDEVGNATTPPATRTATKDTVAPTVTLNAIDSINGAEQNAVDIGGTVTGTSTGTIIRVTVNDGNSATPAVTGQVTVNVDGTWNINDINVSSLDDGPLTFTVRATDAAGNESDPASRTATLDTLAPGVTLDTPAIVNIANENSYSLSGMVSGTNDENTTITVTINDTNSQTAAVTGNVVRNVDGSWTVSGLDLSNLDEGNLNITVIATDSAGNQTTPPVTGTVLKDTVAPTVTLDPIDAINGAEDEAVDISGTVTGASANTIIEVTVNDGNDQTPAVTGQVTVNVDGTWNINDLDVSDLDDGPLTFTVTATDAAGNESAPDSETATKDTSNPGVTLDQPAPVNIANENSYSLSGTVSGTGGADTTITVTIDDSNAATAAVTGSVVRNADGTWTVSGLDVSGLDDGDLSITVIATDNAGNQTTPPVTGTVLKDTEAPTVTIDDVDDLINDSEDEAVDVTGTVTGASANTVITVTVDDNNNATPAVEAEVTVGVDGAWNIDDIDVSSLDDGTLTFTAVATDAGGNASAPDSDTTTKDATTPTVTLDQPATVNAEGQGGVDVSGMVGDTTNATTTIKVVIDDGNNATAPIEQQTTVSADGTWNINDIDVSSLDDGTLTFTVMATDEAGNSSTDSKTALKDTVSVVDITSATDPINEDNQTTATVSGTGEEGATVTVVATDGVTTLPGVTGTVAENGAWSIVVDVSGLADGTITFTATAIDTAGNPSAPDTETSDKDTIDPAIDLTSVTDPITIANHDAAEASGTGEIGAMISVVASDGSHESAAVTTTVDGAGNWTVTGIDLSGLDDGTITFTATATDGANNTSSDTMTATKTTVAITTVTDPINNAGQTNVSISGTGQVGATVTVVVSDGVNPDVTPAPVVIDGGGNWSITGIDVSSLADGTITFTATAEASGDTAVKTRTATKDTVAPAVAVTTVTDPVNTANAASTTASGTAEAGANISLFVTDGTLTTITYNTTADEEGNWSISNIDVSGLADGTLTYVATAADDAGNVSPEALKLSTKDTVAPIVDVTSVTAEIDFDNYKNTSASGTVEIGSTVKVVASDGTNMTASVDAVVDGAGNWTVTGIDVSGLADGTITFTATATDAAGNTATDSLDGVKSTVLITDVTNPIVPTNEEVTMATGTGHPGATITLKVTNGEAESAEYTTTVAEDGAWTIENIDVSTLPDGTVTYTAIATFGTETATSTKTAFKDSDPPDLTINVLPPFINAAQATNASISGTTEPGATVEVRVSTGSTELGPFAAVVQDNGDWSLTGIDVSLLLDSTITFTVTATDGSGLDNQISQTTILDTEPPTVTINGVDEFINGDEDNSVDVSGTVTGASADTEISLTIDDGNGATAAIEREVTVDANGAWIINDIDVSSLDDGTLTFTVVASDAAENDSASASDTATKDTITTVTVTDPAAINAASENSITVEGTGEAGATITLVISDGTNPDVTPPTAVVDGSGNWSIAGIDVSSLADGTLTFAVTAADTAGNNIQDSTTAMKDTTTAVTVTDPATINIANENSLTVQGTGEAGAIITLVVSDGTNPDVTPPTTVVDGSGNWSITGIDVSSLADGTITFMVTGADAVGNIGQDSTTATKDTIEGALLVLDYTDIVTIANHQAATANGIADVGDTVTLVVTDGVNSTVPYTAVFDVAPDPTIWNITGIDLSGLADGPITFMFTSTDTAGNPRHDSKVATKTTVAITSATDPINSANVAGVSINGTGEIGATIALKISNGVNPDIEPATTTVNGSGQWSFSGIDVSSLEDGTITYTVTAIDGTLLTAVATTTATKDTTAPAVMSITRDDTNPTSLQTVHFTVVFTEPVTGVGASTFETVPGGGVTGVTIDDVSGSGTTYTVTASFTSGTGTLGLNVEDVDAIFDLSDNPLGGLGNDNGDFLGPEYTIV